ncbi:hypothetical protein NFI96_026537 [Prochilodus magdalenae]|nr:hypothetical protein NFI96_026537 [Prochilodus magdalenae]
MRTMFKHMLKNLSHPMYHSLEALGSSFSARLLHPRCVKERYRRSFLPAAVRLYNIRCPPWSISTVVYFYNSQVCLRDRLTFRFCQTVQWLGQCDQPGARSQCCKTCEQHHRGNDRATRR